jgi:hypothetical protein
MLRDMRETMPYLGQVPSRKQRRFDANPLELAVGGAR